MPTTPVYCDGGATEAPSGVTALVPNGVSLSCSAACSCWAASRDWACR